MNVGLALRPEEVLWMAEFGIGVVRLALGLVAHGCFAYVEQEEVSLGRGIVGCHGWGNGGEGVGVAFWFVADR